MKFLHTADIHLGKTYRTSAGEAARYEDFFRMLGSIVMDRNAISHCGSGYRYCA